MQQIYIVVSSWGDYEERTEKSIAAFTEKDDAALYVERVRCHHKLYAQALSNITQDLNQWEESNPAPEPPYRAVFDKTRLQDKEYVRQHQILMDINNKERGIYNSVTYPEWENRKKEFLNTIEEGHFAAVFEGSGILPLEVKYNSYQPDYRIDTVELNPVHAASPAPFVV